MTTLSRQVAVEISELKINVIKVLAHKKYVFRNTFFSGAGREREWHSKWGIREIYSSILQKASPAWCRVSNLSQLPVSYIVQFLKFTVIDKALCRFHKYPYDSRGVIYLRYLLSRTNVSFCMNSVKWLLAHS